MELNDQQCVAILTEGLNRSLYENNGGVPQDEKVRLKDATDLVNAAQLASNNGNKSENVEVILHIAQNPPVQNVPVQAPAETALSEEDSPIQGFDITQVSDGVLEGLIIGLDKFPNNENVENERKAYYAEKERRAGAKGQEIPQGEAAQETPEKAGEISAEVPAAGIPTGDQVSGAVGGQDRAAGEGTGIHAEQDSGQGEDAGAFARAQTPETSEKQKTRKVKAVEEDGERAEIESKLTLPMVKAHGIDLTKILDIPTEQLKFIVDNPEGVPEKEIQMPVNEQEVEASAIPNENVKAVGGISAEVSAPVQVVSKADLGLDSIEDNDSSGEISADRERMEAVLTGPILKAYGRGRKEIPIIGDNELKFMIMNPTGKVTPEELETAKVLDNPNSEIEQKVENAVDYPIEGQQELVIKENPTPAQTPPGENKLTEVTLPSGKIIKIATEIVAQEEATKPEQVEETPDRTVIEAAKQSAKKVQAEKEDKAAEFVEAEHAKDNIILVQEDNPMIATHKQVKEAEELENKVGIEVEKTDYDNGGKSIVVNSPGQNRAMEIISRENFPIAPELDENAPILPMDVSAISRDELFSLHAKFHACESRINWILSEYEDQIGDVEKERRYREVIVASEVPFIGEDGKRNTNEYRDTIVNADSEVLDLGKKEHEISKIVKKLKVLQKNYHADCERMSRQMSKYETELKDSP